MTDSPPPAVALNPIHYVLKAGTRLKRLFNPSRYAITAESFRRNGPRMRFDRQSPAKGAPVDAPDRAIYYAGLTLSCCVVGVFGDMRIVVPGDWRVAYPRTTRDLRLLDLRGSGAIRAGCPAVISKLEDRLMTQEWSRHFYEAPEYGRVDGLIYLNAHNDEPALALYERAEDAIECSRRQVMRLADPRLRPTLIEIARENHLGFDPDV